MFYQVLKVQRFDHVMATEQIPFADEDHKKWLKAVDQEVSSKWTLSKDYSMYYFITVTDAYCEDEKLKKIKITMQ